ncbi:MAG: hypothetical protein HY690_08845 [Chloroflexi bacterium]|nr:hypothetical protein [Chloroflexota bacterium]
MRSSIPAEGQPRGSVARRALPAHASFGASFALGLAALAVVAVAAASKAPEFALPLGPNQGVYTYVGEAILDGQAPYRDVWENRLPGVYLVHAALLSLLRQPWATCQVNGLAYRCGHLVLQSFDLVYSVLLATAVFGAARLLRLPSLAGLAAALLCAVFANQALVSDGGATPQKLMLLPATLSFCAFLAYRASGRRGWLVLAGMLGGLALCFNQSGVMVVFALAVARLLDARVWRSRSRAASYAGEMVALAGGTVVPLLGAGLYLASIGALPDFFSQAVLFNLRSASAASNRLAWNFAASLWRNFNQAAGLLWLYAALGAFLLLSGRSTAWRRFPLLAWAGFDCLSLFLGGSNFEDRSYVQLVPSFSLLGAAGLEALVRSDRQGAGMRGLLRDPMAAWLLAASLGVLVLSTPFQAQVVAQTWNDRLARGLALTADELVAAMAPSGQGRLFIWGYAADVYVLSGARAPTRYIHPTPVSQRYAIDPTFRERRARLLEDLRQHPPELIGISPSTVEQDPDGSRFLSISTFPELQAFVREHYVEQDAGDAPGWRLYRLALPAASTAG